ncbi:MAG: ACP S-malonyltransferase [Salinarimonas sp.]
MTQHREAAMHIFPGQGAQFKGMGRDLFSDFKTLTGIAGEVLGYDLARTCIDDPDNRLVSTDVTQPALYTVCMMTWIRNLEQTGEEPIMVAGHSLGEYAALTVAGVFDFADGLALVSRRGALMAQAEGGGMLAVLGDGQERIATIIGDYDALDLANLNTDRQSVVSGRVDQIEAVHSVLQREGYQVIRLQVGGAFHSRLMSDAAQAFRSALDTVTMRPPQIPVIANRTARPYPEDAAGIRDNLAEQIRSPVQWAESIRFMRREGGGNFAEFGPKPVLKPMLEAIA